jgi:hypothetical protein
LQRNLPSGQILLVNLEIKTKRHRSGDRAAESINNLLDRVKDPFRTFLERQKTRIGIQPDLVRQIKQRQNKDEQKEDDPLREEILLAEGRLQ